MRTLFLVLVLANLTLFAWMRYFAPSEATAEVMLARQNEPEKLKIVPPAEGTPQARAATPRPVALTGCLEWGSFTLTDFPRAEKALEPLALGTRLGHRRTEETANYWVFIPPQGSRQAALKKAAELKARGVEDYFIVGDESDSRWALSLGVFRTPEAAQARLAALREQGVRSAIVGSRETLVPKLWLQVRGIDAALEAKLKEIAREIDGTELRACS
jgi:hypothetical protein